MFPRHFFLFAIIGLALFAFASVRAEEEEEQNEGEQRNPLLGIALRLIGKQFAKRGAKCIAKAAAACKDHAKNPKRLFKCAGAFFKKDKGRCAL